MSGDTGTMENGIHPWTYGEGLIESCVVTVVDGREAGVLLS